MESYNTIHLIHKEEKGSKEELGQIEKKQQDDRFKANQSAVISNINYLNTRTTKTKRLSDQRKARPNYMMPTRNTLYI